MTTISASSTIGINLNPAFYTNPVVIGAGVTITNPNYPYGVYRDPGATTFFTIQNHGTIIGSGATYGVGVYLAPGGSVTNAPSASIAGYTGVKISGDAGTVVNGGSIAGGGTTSGVGVYLASGGTVTNTPSASITGYAYGVKISGTAGTVANDGSIVGGRGTGTINPHSPYGVRYFGSAVILSRGGLVTNAAGASIAGYYYGVKIVGGAGTVVNEGSIAIQAGDGRAISLPSGGSVTNAVTGSITASLWGVYINGDAGTVVNDGSIAAQRGVNMISGGTVVNAGKITGTAGSPFGVQLGSGGSVTNTATGSITSTDAVNIYRGAGTVVNAGEIMGTAGAGIQLGSGGSVTNAATGSIAGTSYGVTMTADGALTNAGTIIGNGGTAVAFGGAGSNRLVLDPGFGFSGLVTGRASASNTLELASAASIGTVTGLGTEFLHFGSIVFDAGAEWSIAGLQRGLAGTISGFAVGDTIELAGVTATGSSYVGGILTLNEIVGFETLDLAGNFSTGEFIVTNVTGGADVTLVPCFRAGTRIWTGRSEMAVEELQVGEEVLAHGGDGRMALRRVVWIGHRSVVCRRHPRPHLVWPVRVAAGAFGHGQPHRDLWLSPDHAVFVLDALIPIRLLVNGSSIAQVQVDEVTYYHVELPSHSVVLAEGLPAESYLDAGDHSNFDNADGAMRLFLDFATHSVDAAALWETKGCAPLVLYGRKLEAVRVWVNWLAERVAHAVDAAA